MTGAALIELNNASVRYGGVSALEGVTIRLDAGEIISLMGPNGAGKSTVLKALFGLVPISEGKIFLRGKEIVPVPYLMVKEKVAMVPQGRRVLRHLSIEENLELGAYAAGTRKETRRRMENILDFFVNLKSKRKMNSGALSGGEQQMLAIARGLMSDPEILLLDEPSLGLSPKVIKEVFAFIKKINRELGIAVMIVEHNIKSALEMTKRAYVLDKGKLVAENVPSDIMRSGILEKVFLGKTS